MVETDTNNVPLQSGDNASQRALKRMGFRTLLSWHYLVLFSPLLIASSVSSDPDFVFQRQGVLYFSLAIMFTILTLVSRFAGKKCDPVLSSPSVIAVTCVLACVSTFISSGFVTLPWVAYMGATAFLGISESLLMYVWLHFFMTLAKVGPYKTLGVDIIVGGAIALVVSCLVSPVNIFVSLVLPVFAAFSLMAHKGRYDANYSVPVSMIGSVDSESFEISGAQSKRKTRPVSADDDDGDKHMLFAMKRIIPTTIFAFVFGMVQGAFLSNNIVLLIATSPIVFTSVIVAGVVVFFTPERFCMHNDADTMHRFSLIFAVLGVVLLLLVGSQADSMKGLEVADPIIVIAGIAILAGFNLSDYGGMVKHISLVRRYGKSHIYAVDLGRAGIYSSMFLGLAAGWFVMASGMFDLDTDTKLVSVCCLAVALLVVTVLVPSIMPKGTSDLLVSEFDEEKETETISIVCDHCGSEDSCSIRPMVLANAESLARTVAMEREVEAAQEKQRAAVAAANAAIAAAEEETAKAKKAVQRASEMHTEDDDYDGFHTGSKLRWRIACKTICDRYQLSKRETEIFLLVAKGRNAEYVAQELVISFHTAKTHIANIYQKLGVHSSQEVLDLVETYRTEEDKQAS